MDTTPEPPSPLEEFVKRAERLASGAEHHIPSWLRPGDPESRLPVLFALVAAIALQLAIPKSYTVVPRWPLIGLELLLLAVLTWLNPLRLTNATRLGRYATWVLLAAITLDNTLSAVLLDIRILSGEVSNKAAVLLGSGAAIFVTNIIVFGIWYWELDRGGPFARRAGEQPYPDFMFPQMDPDTAKLVKPGWRPTFVDYLYVSLTNAMAFSPTDTMPLARWAKAMMAVQSLVGGYHHCTRNRKGGERFGLTVQPENRSTFAVMGIATTELTPVEQTAFLTEYARALDSRWSRPILGDRLADEVVGKIDYDFAGLGVQASVVCQTALRAKMLDDRVRDFVEEHPDAVVVDLGAGLDSGVLPSRSAAFGGLVQRGPAGHHGASRRGVAGQPALAFGAGVAGRQALARRHPGRPPDHAHRRRAVRLPVRAGDRRHLPPHHRPLPLRRTGVQRLRPASAGSVASRSSCTRRRCSRTSEASGATPVSRTRTTPRRGIRG